MEKLTDEIILDVINRNNMIGFIIAMVILVFFFFSAFVVLYIGRTKFKTYKKINMQIIIGSIMIILGIFILVICILGLFSKKDWYLYVSKIDDKYVDVESNSEGRDRIYHFVVVDNNKIKITDKEYNLLDKDDKVYVLMVNGHADYVFNTKKYKYVGDKLK